MRRNGAGFTAIELMMVLGVIAILALLAVPSYQEKIVRDQVIEALPLAEIAKGPVAEAPVVPVAWVCGNAAPPDKMTVKGENKTTIPAIFLPLRCRQ